MSIKKACVYGFTVIVIVGIVVLSLPERQVAQENYFVVREEQSKQEVFERGVVVSDDVERVKSGANGVIVEIAESGAFVKKGQLLVRLDSSEAEGWYDDALERIESLESDKRKVQQELSVIKHEEHNRELVDDAELNLAKLALQIEKAGLTVEEKRLLAIDLELSALDVREATERLEREQRMVKKGLASAQDIEQYKRDLIAKQAKMDELQISIRLQEEGAQAEVIEELKTKLAIQEFLVAKSNAVSERRISKTHIQLKTIEESILVERKDMTISGGQVEGAAVYAPRDGIAINKGYSDWRNAGRWVPNAVGSQRYMGDVIFEVIDPSKMCIETLISELDLPLIKEGQQVKIFVSALRNKQYTGVVRSIGGIGMDRQDASRLNDDMGKTGVTVYNATVQIVDSDKQLRPGMSAMISFPATHSVTASLIPMSYLKANADGTFVALKKSGSNMLECTVIGERKGINFVALVSGLEVGDKLVPWVHDD